MDILASKELSVDLSLWRPAAHVRLVSPGAVTVGHVADELVRFLNLANLTTTGREILHTLSPRDRSDGDWATGFDREMLVAELDDVAVALVSNVESLVDRAVQEMRCGGWPAGWPPDWVAEGWREREPERSSVSPPSWGRCGGRPNPVSGAGTSERPCSIVCVSTGDRAGVDLFARGFGRRQPRSRLTSSVDSPTEEAASRIEVQVAAGISMPSASRSARCRRSGSPGTRTSASGETGRAPANQST